MALSTKRKNQIIADWKAGRFKSFYAVSKHYKISEPTAKQILANIPQSNADIVEVGVAYEQAKKLSKNLVEVKAIERLVKELSVADQVEAEAFGATLENIRSVRKKLQQEEVDNMQDHRHAQATIDQALISVGKAPRHANQQINVNTQNNNAQIIVTKEEIKEVISSFDDEY